METGNALRATSDALLRDLDVLVTIEEEKRSLEPGDPRLVELAARIEEIARRVLEGTTRQHDLTRVVNAQVEAGSPHAPDAPIEDTARPIQAVLSDWRDAERRAAAAEPGLGRGGRGERPRRPAARRVPPGPRGRHSPPLAGVARPARPRGSPRMARARRTDLSATSHAIGPAFRGSGAPIRTPRSVGSP